MEDQIQNVCASTITDAWRITAIAIAAAFIAAGWIAAPEVVFAWVRVGGFSAVQRWFQRWFK